MTHSYTRPMAFHPIIPIIFASRYHNSTTLKSPTAELAPGSSPNVDPAFTGIMFALFTAVFIITMISVWRESR